METKHIKIKLSDIEKNPYRDLKRLPLKPEKVEILTNSIDETFFWENIVVRVRPDNNKKYQLGYGHHRIEACKKAGIKEATFIVAELSDSDMVKVMANENMQELGATLDVISETLIQVRIFLNNLLNSSDSTIIPKLYPDLKTLRRAEKAKKVGLDGICRFLGSGWSRATIARTLKVIDSVETKDVSASAVKKFNSPKLAEDFVKKVKADEVKLSDQNKLATEILNSDNGVSISDMLKPRVKANKELTDTKKATTTKKSVSTIENDVDFVVKELVSINAKMTGIVTSFSKLPDVKQHQLAVTSRKFIEYCQSIGIVKIEKALLRKKNNA